MNTNVKALSSEELENISGGSVGQFVKKIAKVTWKTIEVIGTLGGCIVVAGIIYNVTQEIKAGKNFNLTANDENAAKNKKF